MSEERRRPWPSKKTLVTDAVKQMIYQNLSNCFFVEENKTSIEIVTITDVLRRAFNLPIEKLKILKLEKIMTSEVKYASIQSLEQDVCELSEKRYSHYPVCLNGSMPVTSDNLVGIVTTADIAKKHIMNCKLA